MYNMRKSAKEVFRMQIFAQFLKHCWTKKEEFNCENEELCRHRCKIL